MTHKAAQHFDKDGNEQTSALDALTARVTAIENAVGLTPQQPVVGTDHEKAEPGEQPEA